LRDERQTPLKRGFFMGEEVISMEENDSLYKLRSSMQLARQEAFDCPKKTIEILRWMREGVGVYLDEKTGDLPEVIRFSPELVFRTANASFEVTRRHIMQEPPVPSGWGSLRYKTSIVPVEGTPAMENVWMENVMTLLSVI
jgi:hypothetical protein